MKIQVWIVILVCVSFNSYSIGKRNKVWVSSAFNGQVVFDTNRYTINGPNMLTYFTGGNSNICDSTGNLLIQSDGFNLYTPSGNFIDNGDSLVPVDYYLDKDGWSGVPQSSIILPMDSNKYYFITPTLSNDRYADCINNSNCYADLLLYNLIDMNANGGNGTVTKKMIPIMDSAYLSKTQMMACMHGNGKDWWLLKQDGPSNRILKFLFTQDSVYNYGSQSFSQPVWGSIWDLRGEAMFNNDGTVYGSTVYGAPTTGEVFIADFDRCYGELSNPRVIVTPYASIHNPNDSSMGEQASAGLCFSPNGRFLYVCALFNIWQYDFVDSSWYHVAGLDTSWQKFQGNCCMQLGPDNKLYIGNEGGLSQQMSVIDNPDIKGGGCNFCKRCLVFQSPGAGTPPCMPNYDLGAKICWPLNQSESVKTEQEWSVYPNPASAILYFKNADKKMKELYNSVGQLIFSTTKNEIDVLSLLKGVYYLRCEGRSKKVVIE
jgi:Secretion system C-terminal sorting domain